MPNLIEQRVAQARAGENPTVLCQMPSGWAVIGDKQFIQSYCLLLADPVVPDLNSLTGTQRVQFLGDMSIIGDALLEVTGAYRINYEILGNTEPALHVHIFPRYLNEPAEARGVPVWLGYTKDEYYSRPFDLARDKNLKEEISFAIQRRL